MYSIWVNDRLVPEDRAMVSVFDHGFLYGDGVYETVLARSGVILHLSAHLARLRKSASLIRLRLPYDTWRFKEILYQSLDGNNLSEAYIRIMVSRGPGPIGIDPALCASPTLVVFVRPFVPYPETMYRRGVRVVIPSVRRNPRESINPEIKSLNFLNNILAKIEAKKKNAFDAVMLNVRGYVAEGTITNVFMVKKGVLATPSLETGILSGITRQSILKVAGRNGIETVEKLIRPVELYRADEVFITNTTMGIMPVRQVDRVRYAKRQITNLLISAYGEEVQKEVRKGRGPFPR